jgi:predicted RNA methylase
LNVSATTIWQRRRPIADFFTPIASPAIRPLLEEIRLQDALFPDVAAGPGSVATAAHGSGAKAVGLDLSPGMIELAANPIPARLPRSESVWLRDVLVIIVAVTAEIDFKTFAFWRTNVTSKRRL